MITKEQKAACMYIYRTMTIKFVERYQRNADGTMTKTLTAEDFDLPTGVAELLALHNLLGEMLGCKDENCYCVETGFEQGREWVP